MPEHSENLRTQNPTLKRRLASSHTTVGSWITIASPEVSELMAAIGFDWVVIDAEHSVLSTKDVQDHLRALAVHKCPGIVRLGSNDEVQIKRVLDAGAEGIMVPMVNSTEEAKSAVLASRYPTSGVDGRRGVGLARAQGYGAEFETYLHGMGREIAVIVMVEHVDAVQNIEGILSTEGVDAYIIGPYDLSASIGRPGELEHPEVTALIDQIHTAGERHGLPGGIHLVEPDPVRLRALLATGVRFVGYSLDTRVLDRGLRQGLDAVHHAEGQSG